MNKCRDYTRKLGIWLAFFVMISVFFYVPMEVSADSVFESSDIGFRTVESANSLFNLATGWECIDSELASLQEGKLYKIDYVVRGTLNTDFSAEGIMNVDSLNFVYTLPKSTDLVLYKASNARLDSYGVYSFSNSGSFIWEAYPDFWNAGDWYVYLYAVLHSEVVTDLTYNVEFTLEFNNITELSIDEVAEYEKGYSAGFSDGYSDGVDDGYESGFNEGADSVNTDEFYQAGFDSGYSEGFDVALARLENAGADTANYPLLVTSGEYKERTYSVLVKGWTPFEYDCPYSFKTSININPNHTYMFNVDVGNISMSGDNVSVYQSNFNLDVGGIKYRLSTAFDGISEFKIYVPGERMTSTWSFVWNPIAVLYGSESTSTMSSATKYAYITYGFELYDCGPSGDTQNHIANQTDQLTNGYDSSAGDSMNESFSASLTEYQTSEDSLFSAAQSGLDSFTFIDFTSYPALVTAMSFVTSMMTSIFIAMGGETGPVGIVLSVLFSVMLVSMVIGLYRYFQSKGKGGDG